MKKINKKIFKFRMDEKKNEIYLLIYK